jgi:hypothetical protein
MWAGVDQEIVGEAFGQEFFKRYEVGGGAAVDEWMGEIKSRLDSIPQEMCKLLGYPTEPVV